MQATRAIDHIRYDHGGGDTMPEQTGDTLHEHYQPCEVDPTDAAYIRHNMTSKSVVGRGTETQRAQGHARGSGTASLGLWTGTVPTFTLQGFIHRPIPKPFGLSQMVLHVRLIYHNCGGTP